MDEGKVILSSLKVKPAKFQDELYLKFKYFLRNYFYERVEIWNKITSQITFVHIIIEKQVKQLFKGGRPTSKHPWKVKPIVNNSS